MLQLSDLTAEYRAVNDNGDPFGSLMSAFFPVATELAIRGETLPAQEWGYDAGALGPHHDEQDYWMPVVQEASTSALLAFGKMLNRLYEILKAQGKDY